MSIRLRPYQLKAKLAVQAHIASAINVLLVLPTGGGKTVILADVVRENVGPACVVAHRKELVGQISQALARDGVRHRIFAPDKTIRQISKKHREELGKSFVDCNATTAVASSKTLLSRARHIKAWAATVTLAVIDEAHHVLGHNEWGKALALFPNARVLGVTATPTRADGKGLGAHADGVFHVIEEGPTMRELIDAGYLTDYQIYVPPSDLRREDLKVGATGDFTQASAAAAVRGSSIMGDVVEHYLRLARGKLGVTFVPDVDTAKTLVDKFIAAGVPAAVVHAGTASEERDNAIERFRRRELLQLVNVDLFGEGFDLPAIEVVSFARPTKSYALYAQQFGRVLRLLLDPALMKVWDTFTDEERLAHIAASTKPFGLIIDHVGNVLEHNLPDIARVWSLDAKHEARTRRAEDDIPLTTCRNVPGCGRTYQASKPRCPYCQEEPKPANRSGPEYVDGDLQLLDAAALDRLRAAVAHANKTPDDYAKELLARRVPDIGRPRMMRLHKQRAEVISSLQSAMGWWAAYQRARGFEAREIDRRFYHIFGHDKLSAQALPVDEARALVLALYAQIGQLFNEHGSI